MIEKLSSILSSHWQEEMTFDHIHSTVTYNKKNDIAIQQILCIAVWSSVQARESWKPSLSKKIDKKRDFLGKYTIGYHICKVKYKCSN